MGQLFNADMNRKTLVVNDISVASTIFSQCRLEIYFFRQNG